MQQTTYSAAFQNLRKSLLRLYDAGEASAIAREVFYETTGHLYNFSLSESFLTSAQATQIQELTEKLLTGMPLQYAVGYTTFMGRKFWVDSSVLIPRPETEELVAWVISESAGQPKQKILDVGTGSGCINICLQAALPHANVTGIDISEEALAVATKNATENNAAMDFRKVDFLNVQERSELSVFDVIVSNPPYIPVREEGSLAQNVRDWEPRLALFVANDDPLIFYHALALAGKKHLWPGGKIYCELHKDFGADAVSLFHSYGYNGIELRKDFSDNTRMLRVCFS